MKTQLPVLLLFNDYFDINVQLLVTKMRLKLSRKLLRQISLRIFDDIIAHATTQNEHLQQLQKFFDKI